LKRAALLIKEIAGGTISSEIKDSYPNPIKGHNVTFSYKRCNSLIGKEISKEIIDSILENLDIKTLSEKEGILELEVPAYRNDVIREADIVEEILRIYGFNNIDLPTKLNTTLSYSDKIDARKIQNLVSDRFSDNGFAEIMSNSLTKSEYSVKFESKNLNPEHNVKMLNPLSKELDVMRQSLLFNGMEAISYNSNRRNSDLKLYEFGKTYHKYESGFVENQILSVFVTGNDISENWDNSTPKADFYSLKKEVENTLKRLGIFKNYQVSEVENDSISEGLSYSINRKKVVDFGKVKTKINSHFGIKNTVYYAEFNWDTVLNLMVMNKTKFKSLPKFPTSRRDLSLLLDKKVSFSEIQEIAQKVDRKLLKEIGLFDIYEGKNMDKSKKSYAVSFLFLDENKTLVDKQVDKIMSKIQGELESKLGASLR
jgi:phenylalanyl-tRNA synthetase beta chain